jgi:hypothetical protein
MTCARALGARLPEARCLLINRGMPGEGPVLGAGGRPYFHVALNLPHAGRVARRIVPLLPEAGGGDAAEARETAAELVRLLDPCLDLDENPPGDLAAQVRNHAAALGRTLVGSIERGGLGHDRLGQCVRNLFECLELGCEGADISLRAGENPGSIQRPV